MDTTTNPTPLRSTIDEAERIRRRKHEVDFARGSVRYEGGILSDEIDSDELTAAILTSNTVHS